MTRSRWALVLWLSLIAGGVSAEERVDRARREKSDDIQRMFEAAKVAYPPAEIFLRAFKREGELELWAASRKGAPLTRVYTFPICANSGGLGPKRKEGDGQVPEGFYRIDRFNPGSAFHLSLGIDYPNVSDQKRGGRRPGGDIFIHGSCVTIGCLPIEDDPIEILYLVALDARTRGQRDIPVHIFPTRLDDEGLRSLQTLAGEDVALRSFWEELVPFFESFERTRRPPKVSVEAPTGRYLIGGEAVKAGTGATR